MKLVIDISEEDYKRVSTIVDMGLGTNIDEAIKNGTPLENQKTGHWIIYAELTEEWEGTKKYACDKCGEKVGVFKSNYCPNCGAKMEDKENEP